MRRAATPWRLHATWLERLGTPPTPPGKPHAYHFVVYAVDTTIPAKPNTPPLTRSELLDLTKGHVVGRGELVATYERRGEANAPEQDGGPARGRGRRQ